MHTKSLLRVSRLLLFAAAGVLWTASATGQVADVETATAILQDLRSFQELGSVLYVAAHPDDENTQLIAYLARGRHYRTAYLSLTRGDGGQNVLGPEFGAELGLIRTEELLAARRVDGGRQFFSRAIDFGFSKDYRETLSIWDRQQVLADMVRVIREFRPDVVITRFSPVPGGTHGHHTASAVLALEAFKLAGDTNAFVDQLKSLQPWQPVRLLWNAGGFQRGAGASSNTMRMEMGGTDPVTGESYSDIAARSRAMHKTQGFDNFRGFGGAARPEMFEVLEGQPATNDILEGVDTTWNRFPGGDEIGKLTAAALAEFSTNNPAASVPALLKIRSALAALPTDPVVKEKSALLDRIIQSCLGLSVECLVPEAGVVPGEALNLKQTATVQSGVVPVRWLALRYPATGAEVRVDKDLKPGQSVTQDARQSLPPGTPLSQPYWLREQPGTGMFRVDDPSLIGRPENPPAFPVESLFQIGDQTLAVSDEPVQVTTDSTGQTVRQRLDVISPVSLKFGSEVELFAPGGRRPVEIEVTSARPAVSGTLSLNAPSGWSVEPARQNFRLKAAGDKAKFVFQVTAPRSSTTGEISARAEVGGVNYDNGHVEIHYAHVPPLLLQPVARLKTVSLDLAIRGRRVGYVPGAGDSVADALKQMGYEVTELTSAELTPEKLRGLDAVVIGIRALNVRKDLAGKMPELFAFVQNGGNLIVQYNNPNGLQSTQIAPFDLKLSAQRVTDETAKMTFLAPEHPALTTPNRITDADFDGWVQERGLYFPGEWGEQFTPILACNDPGEAPLRGGLLVARYGKGYFVYTGLAWFRQLPAGVPGAYRLFANLVSLGK